MDLTNIHTVYFLGIGGIGMSAIARYFKSQGKVVAGYDKTPTSITSALINEGIAVHFDDDIDTFRSLVTASKSETLVVLTPAIPATHQIWKYLRDEEYTILKRSQVLGLITKHTYTIAVAGTHGKTTTSSIVAHILKQSGHDITAFLGGIARNYDSNFILPNTPQSENIVVVEADEYDRSFLTLFPKAAVITNMDADHLDIYGSKEYMDESYRLFARQTDGFLLVKHGLDIQLPPTQYVTYGIETPEATYNGHNIRIENHSYWFDLQTPEQLIKDLSLGLPGIHNVENAIAASVLCLHQQVTEQQVRAGLASYMGVKRRFDYQIKTDKRVYIDDYAHHPEELKACILSIKAMYPGQQLVGIFQPHLYSRTRDFADGFAESLSLLDDLIMLDIYPARELPIDGVSSQMILDQVSLHNKLLCSKDELLNIIDIKNPPLLVTLGAGDIDTFVEPIKKLLHNK